MRIRFFLHASFEMPGNILDWASRRGYPVAFTRFYEQDTLPDPGDFDLLVVMGGPMGVYDTAAYPYLTEEKEFIKKIVAADKMVLGICLGAQLIAEVLGADVYPNTYPEIGWFPVVPDPNTPGRFLERFPSGPLTAFHWHGDTFDLPHGAQRLFSSEASLNQGFVFDNRIIALQFHWEVTPENVRQLIENTKEPFNGKYVQQPEEMLSVSENFAVVKDFMGKTLDYFEEKFRQSR